MIRQCLSLLLVIILQFESSQSTDVGTFWHFTDFHVDMSYVIKNSTDYWGTYERDTSPIAAFTGIEFGNDMGFAENRPDFVIWGGDAAPHNAKVTMEALLNSMQFLSHHFRQAFDPDDVPLIPVVGNHDVDPPNQMSPEAKDEKRETWCNELASNPKLWKTWIDGAQDSRTRVVGLPEASFNTTCFHSYLINKRRQILVLAINSLVWYANNPLVNTGIKDPLDQFKWIRDNLNWARANNVTVVVTSHIPVGAPEFDPTTYRHLKEEYNEQFVSLLRSYSDVIMTTLVSHEHVDAFRVLLNEKYEPVGTIFLGPSVSPIKLKDIGSSNPRIRQYRYDRETGTVLDYTQYYLDISKRGPAWTEQYQASSTYQLTDLSAQELADLLDEFTSEDDRGRWGSYWNNQLGGRPHLPRPYSRPDGTCPEAHSKCRCEQICSLRHLDTDVLNKCLEICTASNSPVLKTIAQLRKGDSPPVSNTGTVVGSVIGVLLIVGLAAAIGFLVYRRRRDGKWF